MKLLSNIRFNYLKNLNKLNNSKFLTLVKRSFVRNIVKPTGKIGDTSGSLNTLSYKEK